jgi:hypothetical protein
MSAPPILTGDVRTDRALLTFAKLMAEIAANGDASLPSAEPSASARDRVGSESTSLTRAPPRPSAGGCAEHPLGHRQVTCKATQMEEDATESA